MAANSAANTTPMPETSGFTVLATVLATAVPTTKTAAKLKNAENHTAHLAGRARVATTVDTELAASWKPLVKSNSSASAMTATSAIRVRSTALHPAGDVPIASRVASIMTIWGALSSGGVKNR